MQIAKKDEDGQLLVKDSLVTAFFIQKPYPLFVEQLRKIFDQWFHQTPEDAKRWVVVGPDADEYKPATPRLLTRAMSELDPAKAKKRDMCSLEIGGPQEVNSDHRFIFLGMREPEDEETSFIEIRSPSSEAAPDRVERYVEMVRQIAEKIPYDSGYASYALTYGSDAQQDVFARAARKWAFRHPGFDMPDNQSTSNVIARKLRGAYWLTFVGPWALKELGGEKALRKALPNEITLQPAGEGVMIRAGKLPEVGDENRGDKLPLLRVVAKVLEPVTLFEDQFLDDNFIDEDERARWERRHLD